MTAYDAEGGSRAKVPRLPGVAPAQLRKLPCVGAVTQSSSSSRSTLGGPTITVIAEPSPAMAARSTTVVAYASWSDSLSSSPSLSAHPSMTLPGASAAGVSGANEIPICRLGRLMVTENCRSLWPAAFDAP
jgi:hypothetical protein